MKTRKTVVLSFLLLACPILAVSSLGAEIPTAFERPVVSRTVPLSRADALRAVLRIISEEEGRVIARDDTSGLVSFVVTLKTLGLEIHVNVLVVESVAASGCVVYLAPHAGARRARFFDRRFFDRLDQLAREARERAES